jgi:hypothetical protein
MHYYMHDYHICFVVLDPSDMAKLPNPFGKYKHIIFSSKRQSLSAGYTYVHLLWTCIALQGKSSIFDETSISCLDFYGTHAVDWPSFSVRVFPDLLEAAKPNFEPTRFTWRSGPKTVLLVDIWSTASFKKWFDKFLPKRIFHLKYGSAAGWPDELVNKSPKK